MDAIHEKFVEEAKELLNDLEAVLLELEKSPADMKLVERAFRAMHTLKGASAMFGFREISNLTHDLETIYDLIRSGQAVFTAEIQRITFSTIDLSRDFLLGNGDDDNTRQSYQGLLKQVQQLAGNTTAQEKPQPVPVKAETCSTYCIRFEPHEHMLSVGNNPLYVIDDLHALGKCFVYADFSTIPALSEVNAHACYVRWSILLSTKEKEVAIRDVFIFTEGLCALEIAKVSDRDLLDNPGFIQKIEHHIGQHGTLTIDDAKGITMRIDGVTTPAAGKAAPKDGSISSIRVSSEKLDGMVNIVSELITIQARMNLLAVESTNPALISVAEDLEKLLRQLRDTSMSMSLVPMDTLFSRFHRLVKDLATETGKDVALVTEGGDTSLDKSIVENIGDPILHLLRNSIDHGIEDAASRLSAGKPARGKITLRSYYAAGSVMITLEDDGRGMDQQKIKQKAIEKGLIQAGDTLTEKEVLSLIFHAGFSTADKISEISGRGVGMDVVRQKVHELRGEIEIHSVPGKGTTITLKLPLSLSILDGLLVKVHDNRFILPLSVVGKCYEVTRDRLLSFNNLVVLDDEQIPFIDLRKEFHIAGEPPPIAQAIKIQYEDTQVVFIIDSVIGEYQAVLKPLSKFYKANESVLGATILGDGTISLVLDTHRIVRRFSKKVYASI